MVVHTSVEKANNNRNLSVDGRPSGTDKNRVNTMKSEGQKQKSNSSKDCQFPCLVPKRSDVDASDIEQEVIHINKSLSRYPLLPPIEFPGAAPISPPPEVKQLQYEEQQQQRNVAYDVIFDKNRNVEKSLILPPIGSEDAFKNIKKLNIIMSEKYSVNERPKNHSAKRAEEILRGGKKKRAKTCIVNRLIERQESWEQLRAQRINNADTKVHNADQNKEKIRQQNKRKHKAQEEKRRKARAKKLAMMAKEGLLDTQVSQRSSKKTNNSDSNMDVETA